MSIHFYDIDKIIEFRKDLHSHPELSGKEIHTSRKIVRFISKYNPDKIIENIGGYGVIAVFKGSIPGKNIMFRADMDALPIQEESSLNYKSTIKNIAHLCGHDGHSAILINLISRISENRPTRGSVSFLFQPAEETGEGAVNIINDKNFETPDFIFALHNLPGYSKNEILLKAGTFAAASRGMIIKLTGKQSHAAEPEKGISPALAMSELVTFFTELDTMDNLFSDFVLATVVYARLGEIAFGTTPGNAEVMVTLRSFTDNDMQQLTEFSKQKVNGISQKYKIQYELSFVDEFPATVNDPGCIKTITELCNKTGYNYKLLEQPFKWSEDFGRYTLIIPGALIGVGSGEEHPNLHNPGYDFPDEIIPVFTKFLFDVYQKFSEQVKINE